MKERVSIQKELSRKAAERGEKQPPRLAAPNAERKGVKKSVTPLPRRFSHSALGSR